MKKTLVSIVALSLVLICLLASCGGQESSTDMSGFTKLSELEGLRIAAQNGTFHAEALSQIKDVKSSTYPEFADLLMALKSGAIDGYIAEDPTARTECAKDPELGYIPLKNNDTGFTATAKQTGIAIATKKGSDLIKKINAVLAEIPDETKRTLMSQMADLCAGKEVKELALKSEAPASTNGTLKIAMECAYQPYNWTDLGTPTLGAVPMYGDGGKVKNNQYANGYDVQIAQYVANKLGMKLEIYDMKWDSLIPAVQLGTVDAIVAGMSPTPEREQEVDLSDLYYSSDLVIIYKKK